MAACCPNLASISSPADAVEDGRGGGRGVDLASMLASWQPLQHLTSLTLNQEGLAMWSEEWCALGCLTQLQGLEVSFDHLGWLTGVFQLSSLQQLIKLDVQCHFAYPSTSHYNGGRRKQTARKWTGRSHERGSVCSMSWMASLWLYILTLLLPLLPLCLHAPRRWLSHTTIALLLQAADGTTTLAQQLPKALQEAVHGSVFLDRAPEAYHVIFEAQEQQLEQEQAAVKAQQQQLEREQAVVQAQQQQLQQLQGENAQLRQEVGGLQASLAAALQRLSGQEGCGPS